MKALEQGYDDYLVSIHWVVTSHAQKNEWHLLGLSLLHMSSLTINITQAVTKIRYNTHYINVHSLCKTTTMITISTHHNPPGKISIYSGTPLNGHLSTIGTHDIMTILKVLTVSP